MCRWRVLKMLPCIVGYIWVLMAKIIRGKWSWSEAIFQLLLLVMVFVFYMFGRGANRGQFSCQISEVCFFLNYAVAAFVINYWLLPAYLYTKKYIAFAVGVTLVLAVVIFIEEGVIEQIFYPDTRGTSFPGVFFNLASALPTISILSGFKFAWDALANQRELEKLRSAVRESELQFLRSQINPHFLFNNLNNVYSYALEQSPKTPQIILELSGLLRYMLYECTEEYVPLNNELEQLENFVNLSQLQLENRGEVVYENRVNTSGLRIAPLLLSVFVENAFKHSLSSLSEDVRIDIRLELEENKLKFVCENNYSDQSNTESLTHGIGLENVKKRLDILYPNRHQLKLDVTEGHYRVELELELEENA